MSVSRTNYSQSEADILLQRLSRVYYIHQGDNRNVQNRACKRPFTSPNSFHRFSMFRSIKSTSSSTDLQPYTLLSNLAQRACPQRIRALQLNVQDKCFFFLEEIFFLHFLEQMLNKMFHNMGLGMYVISNVTS